MAAYSTSSFACANKGRVAAKLHVVTVPTIHADRLDLVPLSPALLDAILTGRRPDAEAIAGMKLPEGWPDERDRRLLRLRRDQMRQDPGCQQWLLRAMVLRGGQTMVGHIGFHGPPQTIGRAELGYSVVPDHRRRGYAIEATLALMDWAAREHDVRNFFVSIAPDNAASLALATKLGFAKVGEQIDEEDGLEYVFELVRP
jgi:[ribosomal protein S5]-alanine N-acetyltransferase